MSWFGRYGAWVGAMGLAAGLCVASPARAQTTTPALPEPNPFDITPFLGVGFGFSDDPDDLTGSSLVLGVAGAYNWTTNIAFEGELGILPDVVGGADDIDLTLTTFSGNGVYHFDIGRNIVPYATLGLGFARASLDVEDGDEDSSTEFAVNLGGGVKAEIADRAAVRADLRYFTVNDEMPNFWRIYGGVTFRLGH